MIRFFAVQDSANAGASFSWGQTVITLLIGLLTGIFVEPIRKRIFRATLSLGFSGDVNCMRETPMVVRNPRGEPIGNGRMKVARVLVANRSFWTARDCQGFLLQIDKKVQQGTFETVFHDRLPLKWAYLSAQPITIPSKTSSYCDVAGASDWNKTLMPHTEPRTAIFDDIFKDQAIYRFHLLFTAEDAKPVTMILNIEWKGDWNFADAWVDAI